MIILSIRPFVSDLPGAPPKGETGYPEADREFTLRSGSAFGFGRYVKTFLGAHTGERAPQKRLTITMGYAVANN